MKLRSGVTSLHVDHTFICLVPAFGPEPQRDVGCKGCQVFLLNPLLLTVIFGFVSLR